MVIWATPLPLVCPRGLYTAPYVVCVWPLTIKDSGISEDGSMENEHVDQNMTKLCTELQWYVQALETQKSQFNGYPNWFDIINEKNDKKSHNILAIV